MPKFALINGNHISNVIIADDENTALAVSPKGLIAVQCDETVGSDTHEYDLSVKKFVLQAKGNPNA